MAVELRKYPYPYSAAVTVASDTDNATYDRFSAVHALFCGSEVIRPGSEAWRTLGLTKDSRWFDPLAGGVRGLGLALADTFFLIADEISMGMYRYDPGERAFREDSSDGHNACEAIRNWIKRGEIDAFHGFMNFTRDQVLPLLEKFYAWCDGERVAKPRTWINHSVRSCPTGLCPERFRPNKTVTLGRQLLRALLGPATGRKRRPIEWRQRWYYGARPGSPYYINDVLHANGLRYVWLEAGGDELPNVIALPEQIMNGRASVLEPVTMDDGIPYYRFRRCYGKVNAPRGVTAALRTSDVAFDASTLFSAENLDHLCEVRGTCILYTHWTVARSLPVQDATIVNFQRLKTYRDKGKIWVTPLSRLLEWTRLRTFLDYTTSAEPDRLVIDIDSVDDPLFGRQRLDPADCEGLAFDIPPGEGPSVIRVAGRDLPPENVRRAGPVCWVNMDPGSRTAGLAASGKTEG